MIELSSLILEGTTRKGVSFLARKISGTSLGDLLLGTSQEWANDLPDEIAGSREALLRALLQEGKPREKLRTDNGSSTNSREKLTSILRRRTVPDVDTWYDAFVERWKEVSEQVAEEEAHPFFLLQEADARDYLRDLAERFNHTCAQEEDLFRRTIYGILREQSEVRELGSPWQTLAEFFGPYLQTHRLFQHTWTLVGRSKVLETLKNFALEDIAQGDPFIAVLPGRGGIGKSKIAYQLAKRLQEEHGRNIRFIDREQEMELDDLQLLPDEDVFLIADDAQERNDIRTLASLLDQRHHKGHQDKLFILTRPSATERLKSDLTYSGIDPSEYVEFEPLGSLNRDDMRAFAREVLGEAFSQHAEHLVEVAGDSPLVVAVGGQLIQRERISPGLLEQSEDFREVVLARFRDTLIGDIPGQFDSIEVRGVLELTAALSPVRPEDEDYLGLAAEFLDVEDHTIREIYQRLEETGVLLRRGGLVRITPDVLADHILHDACISNLGDSTGFAQEIYNQFSERAAERLLQNLAELDWRLKQSDDHSPNVLQEIWDDIERTFEEADWRERRNILEQVAAAARYLPRKALTLAERAIDRTVEVEDEHRDGFVESKIAEEITKILHRVGLSLDFLPRSLQLLWEMTDDDHLQTSQKAHSKLSDIAEYGRWKPPYVQEIVTDKAKEWLGTGDVYDRDPKRSLIDIVEPILKKSAESSYTEGHTFHMSPFVVNRKWLTIRNLRKRAFRIVQNYGTSQDATLWSALRVLDLYIDMLSGPTPLGGMEVTPADKQQFDPERVWALGAIQELREHWDSPVLGIIAVRRLYWHAEHGGIQRLSRAYHCLKEIVSEIKPTFEFRLVRCLLYSVNFRMPDPEDHPEGFEGHAIGSETLRRGTAQDFLEQFPDSEEGARQIESRLNELDELGDILSQSRPDPRVFLQFLTDEDPDYGASLAHHGIDNPDSYLASHVGGMLTVLGQSDAGRAFQIAQEAIQVHDKLARSVAQSHEAWHESAREKDVDLWGEILQHHNRRVRLAALRSLKSLAFNGEIDPVLQHAPRTLIDDDTEVADELFSLFDAGHAISPESLTEEQIRALLGKLEAVSQLDKHWIRTFLDHASRRTSEAVFDLLIHRLELAPDREVGYHTIGPGRIEELQSPETLEGLRESDDYEDMLREVRSYLLNEDVSAYMASNLFLSLSNGLDETGLEILNEWIESGEEEKMKAACRVFHDIAYDFVLEYPDFVQDTLESAESHSREMLDRFRSSFYSAAMTGSRQRGPHQPAPKDERLRDESLEISDDFPVWSEAHEFYKELSQRAKERIEEDLRRDEELDMQ